MASKLTKKDALAIGKKAEALAKTKIAAVTAALKKKKSAIPKPEWEEMTKLMKTEAAKIKDGNDKKKVLELLSKI